MAELQDGGLLVRIAVQVNLFHNNMVKITVWWINQGRISEYVHCICTCSIYVGRCICNRPYRAIHADMYMYCILYEICALHMACIVHQ